MFACWEGHETIARLLLGAGASPNRRARWVTPLVLAASRGHAPLVQVLLEHGARPHMRHPKGDRFSALVAAAGYGSIECVRLLLDAGESPNAADVPAGNRDGFTALMAAVGFGHIDIVRLLLSRGADQTLRDSTGGCALSTAIFAANPTPGDKPWKADREEILRLLLATNPTLDLHQATALGDREAVRKLLDAGVGVNAGDANDRPALWLAIANDRTEVVELLLERGGRLHLSHWTMLALAADRGRIGMVTYLLDRGFSDIRSDGPSALAVAAMGGYSDVVRLLLDRGVSANADSGSPLHRAASGAHPSVLRLLLSHGGTPNLLDKDRNTALIRAVHSYGS
ncbi:MAG: ankyrin repeat domain-containing protein, partial [Fibrella sp.]|nr:ankyrin repeat domain-containing protein [Armatimonadota bacterium]